MKQLTLKQSNVLEEYEKNNKEAIIPVIKMWHLLMQVEHEKKEIDKNYLMPAEVKQIADKVKEILNLYQTKKKAATAAGNKNSPFIKTLFTKTLSTKNSN